MYWRISSFPELDHLADADRRALIREHAGWKLTIKMIGRSLLGGTAMMVIGCAIVGNVYLWQLAALLSPFFFALGSVMAYQYSLIRIRGQLIMFLEEARRHERLPMCLRCGYNLQGISGSRCPECGYHITRPNAD